MDNPPDYPRIYVAVQSLVEKKRQQIMSGQLRGIAAKQAVEDLLFWQLREIDLKAKLSK